MAVYFYKLVPRYASIRHRDLLTLKKGTGESMVTQEKVKVNVRQDEALSRALSNQSLSNYPAIFRGFIERGIAESEIHPRENVFTYQAWRALGRQVKRGEHGVRICTYIPIDTKEKDSDTGEVTVKTSSRPRMTTVFHITQTDIREGVQNAAI